jgi:hypothetical protein
MGNNIVASKPVKGDDGDQYIIRQDTASGEWELTMFKRQAVSRNIEGIYELAHTRS